MPHGILSELHIHIAKYVFGTTTIVNLKQNRAFNVANPQFLLKKTRVTHLTH